MPQITHMAANSAQLRRDTAVPSLLRIRARPLWPRGAIVEANTDRAGADSGRPGAIRAAAAACARNAVALFVPCHRIIRTDGALGGFRYGLEVKRVLRAHEAAH